MIDKRLLELARHSGQPGSPRAIAVIAQGALIQGTLASEDDFEVATKQKLVRGLNDDEKTYGWDETQALAETAMRHITPSELGGSDVISLIDAHVGLPPLSLKVRALRVALEHVSSWWIVDFDVIHDGPATPSTQVGRTSRDGFAGFGVIVPMDF
jgi:hypothetical protein